MDYIHKQVELEHFLKKLGGFNEDPGDVIIEISEIGNEQELTYGEIGNLYTETLNLLNGTTTFNDLAKKIADRDLYPNPQEPEKIAEKIADVVERIQKKPLDRKRSTSSSASNIETVKPEIIEKTATMVAQKQQLTETQKTKLIAEINKVLKGETKINNFRTNIVEELGITYDQALKIAFDVNANIFNTAADKSEPQTTPQKPVVQNPIQNPLAEPKKLITDHEEMANREGPHLHSETIMPAPKTPQVFKPEPQPEPIKIFTPTTPATPQNQKPPAPFKSIVDEKLSGIVRSSTEKYRGPDPYREPVE